MWAFNYGARMKIIVIQSYCKQLWMSKVVASHTDSVWNVRNAILRFEGKGVQIWHVPR